MSQNRWKVTNSTIKPMKTDAKGNDIRPIRDRVGHPVEFPNGKVVGGKLQLITLYQNKSIMVDDIDDVILRQYKRGYVTIEKTDISDELERFAFKKEDKVESAPAPDSKGAAVPMGETRGEDKPVNPDGEPNFVAKAPHGGLKKTPR